MLDIVKFSGCTDLWVTAATHDRGQRTYIGTTADVIKATYCLEIVAQEKRFRTGGVAASWMIRAFPSGDARRAHQDWKSYCHGDGTVTPSKW